MIFEPQERQCRRSRKKRTNRVCSSNLPYSIENISERAQHRGLNTAELDFSERRSRGNNGHSNGEIKVRDPLQKLRNALQRHRNALQNIYYQPFMKNREVLSYLSSIHELSLLTAPPHDPSAHGIAEGKSAWPVVWGERVQSPFLPDSLCLVLSSRQRVPFGHGICAIGQVETR